MRKFLLYILGLTLCCHLSAQTAVNNAVKEINAIKSDPNFISAESTVKDWETAYENAKILLAKEIEEWLIEQGASNIAGVIATANEHILEIKTTRGSLYRAFVYIKKSDLVPYMDKSKLMVIDVNEEADSVPAAVIANEQNMKHPKVVLTTEEKDMLFVKNASEIKPFIQGRQDANEIISFGKYSTLPFEGCSYIFIYDKEGNVPACLRYENGVAINLATGKEENISDNYKGCGGIWFKLK